MKFQVNLWGKYLRTHFVTTKGLHLRGSLGQWTNDSNLEWRYTQNPIDVLLDATLWFQPGNTCLLISMLYNLQCVATNFPYHQIFDSGYCQLPVPAFCSVPQHDGPGYTTNPPHLSRSRLICCFNPLAPGNCCSTLNYVSDTCMMEPLRSIKSKTISTDGGTSALLAKAPLGGC
jgi:hypothetical protein